MVNGNNEINIKKFNPVEKNLYIGLFGVDEQKLKDSKFLTDLKSGIIKPVKINGLELSPEIYLRPENSFSSINLSTRGSNSYPFLCVKNVLEMAEPVIADIKYFKKGMDIRNTSAIFPKSISQLKEKYSNQLCLEKYRELHSQQLKRGDYEIVLINRKANVEDYLSNYLKQEFSIDLKERSRLNKYILSLEVCMYGCKNPNNYDALEKLISSIGDIRVSCPQTEGWSWIIDEGDASMDSGKDGPVFYIKSTKNDPAKILTKLNVLYAPEKGDATYYANDPAGSRIPFEITGDKDYDYKFISAQSMIKDTIEIAFSRKNKG